MHGTWLIMCLVAFQLAGVGFKVLVEKADHATCRSLLMSIGLLYNFLRSDSVSGI